MVRTEVELTYHKEIAYEGSNHPLYGAMKQAIDHIKETYAITDVDEIKRLTESEYGIKIEALGYLRNPSGYYTYRISFRDERHYLWFMLRWA